MPLNPCQLDDGQFVKGLQEAMKNGWTMDDLLHKRFADFINGAKDYASAKNLANARKSKLRKMYVRETLAKKYPDKTVAEREVIADKLFGLVSAPRGRQSGTADSVNMAKRSLEAAFAALEEEESAE